jgi:hypothetical protein
MEALGAVATLQPQLERPFLPFSVVAFFKVLTLDRTLDHLQLQWNESGSRLTASHQVRPFQAFFRAHGTTPSDDFHTVSPG